MSDKWNEEKETIFFFPELTADHTMFESQFEYFEEKYNLIAWDAPCHGKSRPYDKFDFEDSTDVILQIINENRVENIIGVGQSFGGYLQDNRNLSISCPVLITHGEYDKTGKVCYYCKMWHEQTNYSIQIIRNAGHNANVDNPKEMNCIIEEFIEEKVLCV